ncbi:MAG: uracil-DNA glycosylase [Verrucomicrobiaceae bacterium]|nr:uracil-DNA glycosylase [Verrucomicrobiaceae bacterium]
MSTDSVTLLRQYLEARRDAGRTHVAISAESVRSLPGLEARLERRLAAGGEVVAGDAAAEVEAGTGTVAGGGAKAERLARVRALAEAAPEARALGTLRETMVFAVGNPEARLMLIGEAPGYQEERQREPFVGPAGEKLTQILKAMGLPRESVYISNICKFRPAIDGGGDQGTKNRKPTELEMRVCLPFVKAEIEIVQPVCIVALGATAAEGMGLSGAVGKLRGQVHQVHGTPMIVTYHPSYILREEKEGGGMQVKRQVWEDMLAAMEILGLPISEKQRGYFRVG